MAKKRNANLVPTPTVDKNGRATTVYRKPQQKALLGSLPAPQARLGGHERDESLLTVLAAEIMKSDIGISDISHVEETLRGYPHELLVRLSEAINDDIKNIESVKRAVLARKNYKSINEALYYYPKVTRRTHMGITLRINGLHHNPLLPDSEDFSEESPEIRDKATALLTVINALDAISATSSFVDVSRTFMFKDQRLNEVILDNYERADEIARIIVERRIVDLELILSVIGSDSLALGDGTL